MTTTTTYRYSLESSTKAVVSITEAEVEAMRIGPWQGAEDLPDDTEFATALDCEGNRVLVYRTAA